MELQLFKKPLLFQPSSVLISKARHFAKAVTATTNYSDSRQLIAKKIEQDHFFSKLGEEAVAAVFRDYDLHVEGPDYAIYPGRYKSWDADLTIDDRDVAVKTQSKTSADRYGLSWTFQAGSYRRDPILAIPDYWVALVLCNDQNAHFECAVFPLRQIKNLPFGDPKLERLKGEKLVVYAESLR